MKCSKCGAELSEDIKFCSYCGQKVEKDKTLDDSNASVTENYTETLRVTYEPTTEQYTSISKKENNTRIKKDTEKNNKFWESLNLIEKIATLSLTLFAVMCLIAFSVGKPVAGIIAILQIALIVFALMIKRQLIKMSNSWLKTLAILLSFVLVVPYVATFSSNTNKNKESKPSELQVNTEAEKKFKWSDVVLGDMIPEPESNFGEIIDNSDDYLKIYVFKTKAKQYSEYVNACTEKGFTVEAEKTEYSYNAFNKDGYELDLYYDEDETEMSITLDAPEEYGELDWPNNEITKLIPKPKSKVGKVEESSLYDFCAYIGETSLDDYQEYVKLCSEKGFTIDEDKSKKYFSAKNSDGYELHVDYAGNKRMYITINIPEYQVDIEVKCNENLIFSKYDIEVYIDDSLEGTVDHGTTETYSSTLKRGTHKIKFVNEEDSSVYSEANVDITKEETVKFEISCSSSEININIISGTGKIEHSEKSNKSESKAEESDTKSNESSKSESKTEGNLTIDNCPELAEILNNKAEIDESYSAFASKYEGKVIEFDGRIDNCQNHGSYTTRFDYLVSAGDYDPDHQIGPTFKFEDVSYYDLNTNLDTVSVGLNVHIVAKVENFDSNSGLFFLEPVSITGR